jgi:LuxR family maltose regulon positive regulatory protein
MTTRRNTAGGQPRSAPRPRSWPLIATRLRPPGQRAATIERGRLLRMLDAARDYGVTLIDAPAGYGKTTLLAQWYDAATARGLAVGWFSLDDLEDDPLRFLRYVARALELAVPSSAQRLQESFDTDLGAGPRVALAALLNAFEELTDDVYLVIEDVHYSRNPQTLRMLDALIDAGHDRVHFLISCRQLPAISLARLRMRRSLQEIDAADLQFQRDEALEYFRAQPQLALDETQIAALHAKTDGWIAGLQLAALSLQDGRDPARFIAGFTGGHRNVGSLLAQEVLSRLPDDTVDFLLRTSVLMTFDADVCNLLSGRTDSSGVLATLEQANLFLFPVDDTRTFYRYHGLFAEFLQTVLEERHPGLARELHVRAARWFAAKGYALRAADHALKTHDPWFAAEVLETTAADMVADGNGGTLLACAARLPADAFADFPHLQLQRAYAATLAWRFDVATQALQDVRRALADRSRTARWEERGIDLEKLYIELIHREGQLALLTDDMPRAARLCQEWLESPVEKSPFDEGVGRTSLIYALREQYDVARVETAPAIRRLFSDRQNLWATVWHDTIIGASHLHAGQLDRADALYRRAFDTAREVSGAHSPTAAMPALYLAELCYERDRMNEARELLDSYLPLGGEMGVVDQLLAGYVTAARLRYLDEPGDLRGALAVLDQGDAIAQASGFERLQTHLACERIRLYLATGDLRQAHQFARARDLVGDGARFEPSRGATTALEIRALAWAQVAMSRDQLSEAAAVLDKWHAYADSRRCYRSVVRLGELLARLWVLAGDQRKAQRCLRAALLRGLEGGFVRTFVDGGAPIRDLLARLATVGQDESDPLRQYQALLLQRFGAGAPLPSSETAATRTLQAAAESLGPREMEVLVRVARGLMNSQIADELGLTVGTVKWYMQQIFAKLDVTRRSQAVHRAREVGLLR